MEHSANIISLKELKIENQEAILYFASQLNPTKSVEALRQSIQEMFQFDRYYCFGLFLDDKMVGISSAWVTVRFYSGKQLELDNVIVDNTLRSTGLGKHFLELIEKWAVERDFQTIELNTYVGNTSSHKFYFNMGYIILGYHFQKVIGNNVKNSDSGGC